MMACALRHTSHRALAACLLALAMLAIASCGDRAGFAKDAFPDPGTDALAIAASLTPKSVGVGERALLRVTARVAPKFEIVQRARLEEGVLWARQMRAQAATTFVIDEKGRTWTEVEDGARKIYFEVGLRALDFGELRVPKLTLRVRAGENVDAEPRSVSTEALTLSVVPALDEEQSVAAAEVDPAFVADAPPPPLWPWLVGLGVLALFALGIVLVRRRARRLAEQRPVYRVPPDREALARLRELERMLENGEIGAESLVVECSQVLRRWLELGLKHEALAKTSDEFLAELRATTSFSVAQQNRLQDFLRRTDLIKFAGQSAGLSECRELLQSVHAFVEETREDEAASERGPQAEGASAVAGALAFARFEDGAASAPSLFEWQQELFGFAFADPAFLLFLLAIPVLFFWTRRRARPALGHASLRAFDGVPTTWRVRFSWLPRALTYASLVALILACARPQTFERVELETQGIDILLALDLSSSMAARDMAGQGAPTGRGDTRLDVVKRVAKRFIEARASDRVGLVTFARYPDLTCPSTLDTEALLRFLEPLRHKRIARALGDRPDPEDGTAIGAALALCVRRLSSIDTKSRVAVLLSDGTENVNTIDPAAAAKLAKDEGVRVYTIGAGRPVRDAFGRVHKQDFSILQKIASTTGGAFFEAQSETALSKVFEKIDQLERSDLDDPIFAVDEQFLALLVAGFSLLAVGAFLELLVFVTLP